MHATRNQNMTGACKRTVSMLAFDRHHETDRKLAMTATRKRKVSREKNGSQAGARAKAPVQHAVVAGA